MPPAGPDVGPPPTPGPGCNPLTRFHMRPSPIFRRPEFSEGELLFATECFLDANLEPLQLELSSKKILVENVKIHQTASY